MDRRVVREWLCEKRCFAACELMRRADEAARRGLEEAGRVIAGRQREAQLPAARFAAARIFLLTLVGEIDHVFLAGIRQRGRQRVGGRRRAEIAGRGHVYEVRAVNEGREVFQPASDVGAAGGGAVLAPGGLDREINHVVVAAAADHRPRPLAMDRPRFLVQTVRAGVVLIEHDRLAGRVTSRPQVVDAVELEVALHEPPQRRERPAAEGQLLVVVHVDGVHVRVVGQHVERRVAPEALDRHLEDEMALRQCRLLFPDHPADGI